ncbi:MAG: calcium-binding protein, partial [Polyangiaceae bacterium]
MLFGIRFRSLALALTMATFGVGCQVLFGDFHVDDNAFASAGTDNGSGGDGEGGTGTGGGTGGKDGNGAGNGGHIDAEGGGGGDPDVQTGPFLVTPTRGLYTTEWGMQASFSIVLTQRPTAPVSIGLSSDDTNEGRISVDGLTFTVDDWNAPQLVVVTGRDDAQPDGNQTYKIVTAPAKSDDKAFDGKDPADVTLTNIDNETAGITIAPTSGLVTSESGAMDTFTVVLNSQPKKDVTIGLSSSKPTEGTVNPTSLVFTDTNWMAPQLVTVTGVNDDAKDKAQRYQIVTAPSKSDDPTYNGVDADDVDVLNLDNETAGVTVVLISGMDPLEPTKLRTTEDQNGESATFTVELNAPPSSDVTIPLSSSAPSEGKVSPASLTFTKDNWHAPQLVTVTGVEDDETADGNQPYSIELEPADSKDTDYEGFDAEDVPAINADNDKPGFTVKLVSGIDSKDPTKLFTTEAGGSATFSIALTSKPKAPVSIKLSSSLTTEGTVSPTVLTFTKDNYKAPQLVTVKGADDLMQDGDQVYSVQTAVATSDDAGYVLDPPDVQVTNQDDDSAGVIIALATGIDPTNTLKLVTGENGDTASF